MIEVLSLVNFNNVRRVAYLDRGFGSFYKYFPNARHVILDSSKNADAQKSWYERNRAEWYHVPDMPYGERLKMGVGKLKEDYFLFLPDDFEFIFAFELERAIDQAKKYRIQALKLGCRGMSWYAEKNPTPQGWFEGARLCSGEVLIPMGDLFVSKRQWRRNFHEQFSLGCGVMASAFARKAFGRIPGFATSPGNAEKWGYLVLSLTRYLTAYYKMQTPVFHFTDLQIEGDTPKNRERAGTNLLPQNRALYNRLFNRVAE